MSIFFNYNGNFFKGGSAVITPDNPSLKFGDGLFETIRIKNGELQLWDYHFERLLGGLNVLGIDLTSSFTSNFLEESIITLAQKNNHLSSARARLMLFRGDGNFIKPSNNFSNYILQTWEFSEGAFNERGLDISIYTEGKKSCDTLSNLKTNNFLLYTLAANYAKKNAADDAIVLNTQNNICDTSMANIFLVKNKLIFTPSLSQGCISGVMRKHLIETLASKKINVKEGAITIDDLTHADEVFFTNSLHPVRWVKQFQNRVYTNEQTREIYEIMMKTF